MGWSFAYFSVIFEDNRLENNQGETIVKTEELPDAVVISNIDKSAGKFEASDIYPGHKEVASLSVSANGVVGTSASYQFKYEINTNELGDAVKVRLYVTDTPIETSANYFNCQKTYETIEGETRYFETCEEKNLGTLLEETLLMGGKETKIIGKDSIVVTKSEENTTKYYYAVVEFLNKRNSQNEVMNKRLDGIIQVELIADKVKYNETILHGADPIIKGDLVPVTIENDGTVKKADTKSKWYSYEEKIWANAVILKDKSIAYHEEDTIPEENIESYFVWIPRYKYKIFNDEKYSGPTDVDTTKVQRIEIEFESKDVEPSNGSSKDEWLTHPAFTSMESNGMWVGKFETSKNNAAPDNSRNAEGVQIKPNVVSWRNIQVGNAFYTTYYYNRNLDSHLMKNSEWGAIAYLQHSKYGSEQAVRLNNNSNYVTGYASVNAPTCGYTNDNRACNQYGTSSNITLPYNTETGYLASTTGNISGIYDMAGGAWEYVMGVMTNQSGVPFSGRNASYNSGFTGPYGEGGSLASGYSWPDSRYYDTYSYHTSPTEYTRGHLGDATTEMGPFKRIIYANNIEQFINSWYSGHSYFVSPTLPWFIRGGTYNGGGESGVFAFGWHIGSMHPSHGFRVVLTI